MTTSEALDKIGKALALLALQTRAENLVGMYSKNRLAEDLLKPLFRIIYSAPDLQNTNLGKANFPYIDLADANTRLAIQVTTTRSASKITTTLTKFIQHKYHLNYDRLIFFILTSHPLKYQSASHAQWKTICKNHLTFNSSDIVSTLDLFAAIQRLPHATIIIIHDIIAASLIGEEFVDVDKCLTEQSRSQLESEKLSAKYIPQIFVELGDAKQLARLFAHPALFFNRTLDSLKRINIRGSNLTLAKAGLAPLIFPQSTSFHKTESLAEVSVAAGELQTSIKGLLPIITTYQGLNTEAPSSVPVKKSKRYAFDQIVYQINNIGYSLDRVTREILNELGTIQARIFILTGRAGQGKTNMVCDFLENFLWKHTVPCAYISGRRISSMSALNLPDMIQRLLFDGKVSSFSESAKLLSKHASRKNKPFVLIIDGLNEHHNISHFSNQLGQFLELLMQYPHLKAFVTCRSEFFKQRFGHLLTSALQPHIFLYESNQNRYEAETDEQVVLSYFKFFKLDRTRIAEHALDSLRKDMLLLRFFCEAYGARGKPADYRQPIIPNIYREEIFRNYLERKLGTVDLSLQRASSKSYPISPKTELTKVLGIILQHMLETWEFSDAPISVIPEALHDALYALLDEELILRKDIPQGTSVFSLSSDTVNFTFDEFRDFLLAQYLLDPVYANDKSRFEQYITKSDPKSTQIVEGIKKFLFYASMRNENLNFWTDYSKSRWYSEVYDREIFNIEPSALKPEDRAIALKALETCDNRAKNYALSLATCWHPQRYPLLNLDLLVSFIIGSDNVHYDSLVAENFSIKSYNNEGISADAFCDFFSKHIIPRLKFSKTMPESAMIKFLILLLPIDSGIYLTSKSFSVLGDMLQRFSSPTLAFLRESLNFRPDRHRPFVWRLAASTTPKISNTNEWRRLAKREISEQQHNPVLLREAERFLERLEADMIDVSP